MTMSRTEPLRLLVLMALAVVCLCAALLCAVPEFAGASFANHALHSDKIIFQDHVVDTVQEDSADISQIPDADETLSQFYVHMRSRRPGNMMRLLREEFGSIAEPHYIPHNTYTIVAPRNRVARAVSRLKGMEGMSGLWVREVDHEDKVCPMLRKLMKRASKQQQQQQDGVLSAEELLEDDSFMNEGDMIGMDVLLADDVVSDVRSLAREWRSQIMSQRGIKDVRVGPVSRRRLHVSVGSPRDAMDVLEWIGDQHVTAHIQHREVFESLDRIDGDDNDWLLMENSSDDRDNGDNNGDDDDEQLQSGFDGVLGAVDPLSEDYKDVLRSAAVHYSGSEIGQPSMPDVQYLWSKGLTGEGEVVGVGDTGIDYNTCFFHDPRHSVPFNRIDMRHRKIVGYFTHADDRDYIDGHGTHVAGIVVGDSAEMPQFNGVQSKAKVVFVDIGMPDKRLSMPADLTEDYFPLMYNATPITSNSWGNKRFGEYTLAAREIDQFSWEHDDFLALFAAGNSGRSGSGTLTPPGTAKNCLTVGASQSSAQAFRFGYPLYAELLKDQVAEQICSRDSHFYSSEPFCRTLGKSAPCNAESKALCARIKRAKDCCGNVFLRRLCCANHLAQQVRAHPERFSMDNMATFSSRGPTKDKRLKPDVVIPGQPIFSARSDGTSSKEHSPVPLVMQGTSMSTPIVAGYALMARQYFKKGFYPTGEPNARDGFVPTGALLKAVIIHSAVDLQGMVDWNGREDWRRLARAPSFVQGFGRVAMTNVLKFAQDSRFDLFKEEARLRTGETAEMCFRFDGPSKGDTRSGAPAFRTTLVWMDYPASPSAAITLVNNLDLMVLEEQQDGEDGSNSSNIRRRHLGNGRRDFVNNVEQVTLSKVSRPTTMRTIVHATNVPHGPQKFALVATCVGCRRVKCESKAADEVAQLFEESEKQSDSEDEFERMLLDLLTDPELSVHNGNDAE